MKRLLLLSNSTSYDGGYLDHAMTAILEVFAGAKRMVFVPFAIHDHAAYTARVRERFAAEGIEVEGLAAGADGARALDHAEAVFVGGGNTFRLLDALQRAGFVEPLRRRALGGMPYLGSSAGSVIAAPTLKTTNDMPIVRPESFDALGLVPFQVNAHYFDADPESKHMGETRDDRLREYLEENDLPVVGIREGAWLRVAGDEVRLEGRAGARLFCRGAEPVEFQPGQLLPHPVGD